MAKKPTRRTNWRSTRYIRGTIDENFPLGTLAATTAVLEATQAVAERTFISSISASYSLSGFTAADNAGPIEIGVAHSDYSLVEVEEWIERLTSWSEADLVSREVSDRKIRRIGMFDIPASVGESIALFDGIMVNTKLGWILNAGQGLNFYAYNVGSAALATSDPNVHCNGQANLWPR